MASKVGVGEAKSWSALVTVETYVTPDGARQVTPRILEIERGVQRAPLSPRGLSTVLVLKGTVADDGTHSSMTVKTYARTNHRDRRVLVTLDIVSEPRAGVPRHEPFDRPLVVTVRPDPQGTPFDDVPYEVVVQTSEETPLARAELVLADAA